jgi:hypothetical protein
MLAFLIWQIGFGLFTPSIKENEHQVGTVARDFFGLCGQFP